MRWWDKDQKYDILQTFYYPNTVTRYSLSRGIKTVSYVCLDGLTSRNQFLTKISELEMELYRRIRPSIADNLGYRMSEIGAKFIVPSRGEIRYLEQLFKVNRERCHVILHGVDEVYKSQRWSGKKEYLVSVGSICRRKNSLILAKVANALKVPVIFIGRMQENDKDYLRLFQNEVNNIYVTHLGNVEDLEKIEYIKDSRGVVSLSRGESGGISNLEAIALGAPLILPRYDWATLTYEGYPSYVDMSSWKLMLSSLSAALEGLKPVVGFYTPSWDEVASQCLDVYKGLLT